jgi:predicted nucleic acid-binding protein
MISVVFDACVLYSAALRDFLLRFAEGENILVRPHWSDEIQNEWTRSLLENRPDLKRENLERTRREMDFNFPKGCVRGYKSIIPTLWLPDEKDRHVLAVAIHAKVEYIVTFNLKDFPPSSLAPYHVKAISPDDFVLRVIEYDAETVIETTARHRAYLTRPSKTVDEYLATREKQGLSKTVAFLRKPHNPIACLN